MLMFTVTVVLPHCYCITGRVRKETFLRCCLNTCRMSLPVFNDMTETYHWTIKHIYSSEEHRALPSNFTLHPHKYRSGWVWAVPALHSQVIEMRGLIYFVLGTCPGHHLGLIPIARTCLYMESLFCCLSNIQICSFQGVTWFLLADTQKKKLFEY